jgi:hypothetical protein
MLHWIVKLGGLPIMMGQHDRSESLFYYFRIEDQVPENHLLRLIDRHEEALGLLATKQTIPSPQALRPERR